MIFAELQCTRCFFEMLASQNGFPYVIWANKEFPLGHPLEASIVRKVANLSWEQAIAQGILQQKHACLCFDCASKFSLDVERDIKRCPNCESYNVRTFRASIAAECPSCHEGILKHKITAIA